ncbi:hypothetical protein LVJ83_07065 [Uruburuella testudinis]|uniref:Uncharacterized protein n=1 Tax=Uruburuella testudinis TaxID=1282863 RepID=A0ABY4DNX1_9NEIS|nr:hypothetical protein [Uruburuella testudinis]UOO80750.1 hypothetical protein LVJ83_07065 [Uruburuella testudinis]
MVAAVAGKQAGLGVDGIAAARSFALVEIAGSFPGAAEGDLYSGTGAALFAGLRQRILHAFDIQTAFNIGIDAVGGDGGAA